MKRVLLGLFVLAVLPTMAMARDRDDYRRDGGGYRSYDRGSYRYDSYRPIYRPYVYSYSYAPVYVAPPVYDYAPTYYYPPTYDYAPSYDYAPTYYYPSRYYTPSYYYYPSTSWSFSFGFRR